MSTIQDFINFLNSFNRANCPEKYYQAWKVLILKTDEYRTLSNNEFSILHNSYETFKMEKYNGKI